MNLIKSFSKISLIALFNNLVLNSCSKTIGIQSLLLVEKERARQNVKEGRGIGIGGVFRW